MAGPFYNPQAGMGIEAAGASAVVSPVAPVRTSGADAVTAGLNLASQGVSLYGQYQRSQGRYGGTRSGRPDPNLARFSEEVQIALRNKEQFGEGRFKMDMNRIVQNFGSAGQPIDEDMLDYFEQTTGLPSDTYFGIDPVEKFKAAQIQTPEIQAAAAPLIAAGMDQEKALNQALEEQQTFTRLSEKLSQTDTQNAVEYMASNGGQETQQGIIQFFRDTAYSRLTALVNTGKATEQDARIVLSNYQALLATPKMQIPSGVSAEVRAQEIASRNNLKGSIETVVKLLDAGEQGQSLLQQITQNPKMSDDDKKNMFARFTLLSATDPFQLMSFMGIEDMNALIKGNTSLGNLPPSNFELRNLNNVTAKGLATAPPGQNPPPEEIVPPELSDAIKKMSPSELVSFTQGNAKKASFGNFNFNSQEDVKAFATSVYSVAQGLTAPQQNRLRTIDDLGKLLNRNIFKNLDSLDKVDPEQAALLRASLSIGLTTELGRRKVQLSSIEKSLVGDATADGIITAKFNQETGKYELTPEFINSQTPEDMKSFQVGVEYAYGGDLAKGAENNFVRLTTARSPNQGPGDASKVVSDGNLIRIEDAQRNRRATSALQQFYSSLDAGGQLPPLAQEFSDPSAEARRVAATVAGTAPMDQGQTMDQAPPPAIVQPAGATSGISSVTEGGAGFTTVTKADGTVVKREGLRSWRNNNPGNLEEGDFATSKGAIGSDGRFAVFKTYEEGREAMQSLLFEGKNYRDKTISEAISRYAPPKENDTDLYIKRVTDALGVSDSTKLSDLSGDQRATMLDAMQKHEGFKEGTETVVEPSSGTGLDSQGRPFIRPEVGAEVTESSMLSGVVSSIRSALGLGSDEEAQSVAEKLMQSGVIPRRPEGLSIDEPMRLPPAVEPEGTSVDEPMRLPPRRPTEQGMAEANQLTPSEQRIADAQVRLEERNTANQGLNKETLSLVESSVPTVNWLRSLGKTVGNLVTGSPAEAAEYKEKVDKAIELANKNPLEFIYKAGDLLGLDEDNPEHQKAIAGMVNGFVKGKVNPFSDIRKDSNAWCAAFVGHVLTNLGFDVPGGSKYNALRAAKYAKLGKGVALDEAKAGDLVIIQNPRTSGYHVGFFVDSTSNGIAILGGNQNDEVNITRYPSGRLIKNGIRRIDGMEDISPEALKAVQADMSEFAGQSISNMVRRVGDSISNLRTR